MGTMAECVLSLSGTHPLVGLIKQCLHNYPAQRPRTGDVVTKLREIQTPGKCEWEGTNLAVRMATFSFVLCTLYHITNHMIIRISAPFLYMNVIMTSLVHH